MNLCGKWIWTLKSVPTACRYVKKNQINNSECNDGEVDFEEEELDGYGKEYSEYPEDNTEFKI